MPIRMLLFLAVVALADSRRFEQISDVVAALQVAQQTTVPKMAFPVMTSC